MFRQSLQEDANDSLDVISQLWLGCKDKSMNPRVQAYLDETRATVVSVQEGGEEYLRDNATWHVSHHSGFKKAKKSFTKHKT